MSYKLHLGNCVVLGVPMSYLLFARLRGVGAPWFVVSLVTFPEKLAVDLVQKLNKADWEYSSHEVGGERLVTATKEEMN